MAPHGGSPGSPPPTATVVIQQPGCPQQHPAIDHRPEQHEVWMDLSHRVSALEAKSGYQESVAHRLESKLSDMEGHGARANPQVELAELRRALDDAIMLGREQDQFQRWQQGSLREWDQELAEAERRIHSSASAIKAELNQIGPAVADLEYRTTGLKEIVSTCGAGVAQLDKLMVENKRRCSELQKDMGACERGVACLGSNVEGQRLRVEALEARSGAMGAHTQPSEALRKLEDRVEELLRASHDSTGKLNNTERPHHDDVMEQMRRHFEEEMRRIEDRLADESHRHEASIKELRKDIHESHGRHHEVEWKEQTNAIHADQLQLAHRVEELTGRVTELAQDIAKHRHHSKHHEAGLKEHYEGTRASQQKLVQQVEDLTAQVLTLREAGRANSSASLPHASEPILQTLAKLEKLVLREVEQRELSLHELREHVQSEHERHRRRLDDLHIHATSLDGHRGDRSDLEADVLHRATGSTLRIMQSPLKETSEGIEDVQRMRRENVEGTLGKLRGQLRIIKQELAASSSQDVDRVQPNFADTYLEQENIISFDAGKPVAVPVEPGGKPMLPAPTAAGPCQACSPARVRCATCATLPVWSPITVSPLSGGPRTTTVTTVPASPRWSIPQRQAPE